MRSVFYKSTIKPSTPQQAGNVLFAVFGAIALVGVLSASMMTFMKGPLATSIKLTKMNTAESQMTIGAQVAVMATAAQANNGDCDLDGYVEPLEWRTATTEPIPTGGGLIPLSLGISKKDPWGTEYGYCVWNHGPTLSGSGCAANMLNGYNSNANTVVALISAGPDKAFTTTCRDFATADVVANGVLTDATDLPLVSKAAETDDDIITSYTYQEATGASGGLWNLKAADPSTAVINKKIETTGSASFAGGILLPDKSLITCDATNAGVMAKTTASGGGIEICDGAGGWTIIGGSGTATGFDSTGTCASAADAGKVRYNSVSGLPEFCNGTGWLPFSINIPGINLVLTPSSNNAMNVDGTVNEDVITCTVASGYYCGTEYTFTLTNNGTLISSLLSYSLTNSTNFAITLNTCSVAGGNADGKLDPNESCSIKIRPKANGNTTYTGNLQITGDNNPFAIMQGTSTGFGCDSGRLGGGGYYVACGISDPDGTYNLIIMPGGCNGAVSNPTCGTNTTADTAAVSRAYASSNSVIPANVTSYSTQSWGARQHQNIMAYSAMAATILPAAQYCDDMIYGGKSDWYLPSYREWEYVRSAAAAGKFAFAAQAFKLSDLSTYNGDTLRSLEWVGGATPFYRDDQGKTNIQPVRCIRRDDLPLPAATADIDPDAIIISPAVVFAASGVGTSNTVTVTGILQTITVSMTGGTGMDIIKNGVPTGLSSISGVKLSDTLAFRMNAPAVLGTKNTATVDIGTDTYTWWVGYADSAREQRVFVTPTPTAFFGSIAAADNLCNTAASASIIGLPPLWKAYLSNSSTDASSRIAWNFGLLKTVTGTVVVDGGFPDLMDGTVDSFVNIDSNGATVGTGNVYTGSLRGSRVNPQGSTSSVGWCYDWAGDGSSGAYSVYAGSVASYSWESYTTIGCYTGWSPSGRLYCFEDIDNAVVDIVPSAFSLQYKIQVPVSSRQTSSTVVIGGMSSGATTTLSVAATGGTPTFTVNGGAEVTSATVQNGDSIVFLMDAPATDNSNNKMTITGGAATLAIWRVWTGDSTGTVVKRVFVDSSQYAGSFGGVTTADSYCQTRATSAALGGTWKAIISGITEAEYAVNRVGYNWSTLTLVDNTTVVTNAGGLWETATTPFLSSIIKTETGAVSASKYTYTNTAHTGLAAVSSSNGPYNCNNWTSGNLGSATQYGGNSSSTGTGWINFAIWTTGCYGASGVSLFCIEQ